MQEPCISIINLGCDIYHAISLSATNTFRSGEFLIPKLSRLILRSRRKLFIVKSKQYHDILIRIIICGGRGHLNNSVVPLLFPPIHPHNPCQNGGICEAAMYANVSPDSLDKIVTIARHDT